jgi:hypothetical protein
MSIGLIDQVVLEIRISLGPGCANGADWTSNRASGEKRYAAWFAIVKRKMVKTLCRQMTLEVGWFV